MSLLPQSAFPVYSNSIATATLLSNASYTSAGITYTVASVNIINGGANFNYAPQLVIKGGGGRYAQATAVINNGTITNVVVVNQGEGYTGIPAIQVRDADTQSIGTILIANTGSGYSANPTAVISAPTYANGQPNPTGVQAAANLILSNNAVTSVVISNNGTGYYQVPSIKVSAAQNNYPAFSAQLNAVMNTGTGAVLNAVLLPEYIGGLVEGGSYYLRPSATTTLNGSLSSDFVGNIVIEGSLSPDQNDIKWFTVASYPVNANLTTFNQTIQGNFVWLRAKVQDFAAGTVNTLTATYSYV